MRNQSKLCIKLYLLMAVLGAWTSLNAQIGKVKDISCPGLSDGALNVVVPASYTGPYSYLWNTGSTDDIIGNLSAGTYSVTVTHSSGTVTFSYILKNPSPIANVFTIGANNSWLPNDGSISITTSGGTGLYKHNVVDSISRDLISSPYSGLAPGSYFITTTDGNGCIKKDTVTIIDNASNNAKVTIDTTACYKNVASSSIIPDTTNTEFPVNIYLDKEATPYKTILGYRRNATDSTYYDGIIASPTILGLNKQPSNLYFVMETDLVAAGHPNAGKDTIKTVVGSFSNSFEPGFHMFTVITADGKGYRYSWDVDSVVAPVSINFTQINNLCYGGKAGSLVAVAQGSYQQYKQPYTYSISGPAGFTTVATSSASALAAGIYTVTATDWATCSGTQTVTITQPDEPIRINLNKLKNSTCPYSADGGIQITSVEGAEGAVNYTWSTGSTSKDLDHITAGTYSVTITDGNNCTATDSITISGERKNCFYNIITPNGDGFNDKFDLTDFCVGVQMKAVIFNEAGKLIATLDENNPIWDAYDSSMPPTGVSSTYTAFVSLFEKGVKTVEFSESFSVVYPKK